MKGKIKSMKGLSNGQLFIIISEFIWKDLHRERSFIVLMGY
ncbi:hypothetical protein H312_00675 [Anncaliia algerae PRA339]|uniref:Uncharacterized protein n=1 Tax=Anncaliia algerae PRA339 TaxID=1288291 RepID=A0A059F4I3_9MICR|nr:hypothetical protein H312_00675 [Anncaliia algerae PRA339]